MMAMAGFFLGPKLVLLTIWVASVSGALQTGSRAARAGMIPLRRDGARWLENGRTSLAELVRD